MRFRLLLLLILPELYTGKAILWLKNNLAIEKIQSKQEPSLTKTLDEEYADSLMVIASENIRQGAYNEAKDIIIQSIAIYKKINNNKKAAGCLNKLGTTYYYQSNYDSALLYYNQGVETYKIINDKKGITSTMNNIGNIYYYLGNYPEALHYYQNALELQIDLNNKALIANLTLNIGGVYLEIEDFTNAMDYLKKALKIYEEQKNHDAISQSLNGIGEIYMKQGDLTNAIKFFNKSLQVAVNINNKQRKVEVLYNLGELYLAEKNFETAFRYMQLCLKDAQEISSLRYISISQISIAKNLRESNKNQEAISYCKQGLNIATKIGAVSVQRDACECLYLIYKDLGNNRNALKYYEQKNALEDSLRTEETAHNILNMEFQKQELIDSLAYAKKEYEFQQIHQEEIHQKEKQRNIFLASVCFVLLIAGGLWTRLNYMRKSKAKLQIEKNRSESLLLNILPEEIAEELKHKGYVDARDFNLVPILFSDFKSFTETSEKLTPHALVNEINICFKEFDMITERYGLEKIKTIGDAYMVAGGLPVPDKDAVKKIILAGLDMQSFICQRKMKHELLGLPAFEMRVGIHAGPIVAGIVGVKKFQYDVWGDTVNIASRIESNGEVRKVNVSEAIYKLAENENDLIFECRGLIKAKGKGEMKMYFVKKRNFQEIDTEAEYKEYSAVL